MTVITTTNLISHEADGTEVDYPYDFLVLDASHVVCTLDEVVISPAGYTVEDVGEAMGGNVKFTDPPAAGTLLISRQVPIDQLVDYQVGGPFPSETHEGALDKLTMIAQQQQEQLSRSILAAPGGGSFEFKFTQPYNSTILAFDENGEFIINQPTAEEKAYRWAETDVDQVVEFRDGRNRYSAYHWSVKAFNAVSLPLDNRGDIMVGDGTTSPATIIPVGPNGSFLRSAVDSDPGAVPTGLIWDEVPETLPPIVPGDKLKILHVKADETGFELTNDYASTLYTADKWAGDDESDGDKTALVKPHYQQSAMNFQTPGAGIQAAHILGVAFQNHDSVDWAIELTGAIGEGESGLTGTKVRFELTPYIYWRDSTLAPTALAAVEAEMTIDPNDDFTPVRFTFIDLVPKNTNGEHDVLGSIKVRRIGVANAPDEYQGTFSTVLAVTVPS